MKYELEQLIYYMRDNKPHSAPVLARMMVENLHQDLAHTKEQKGLFMPFGEAGVFYGTCHGLINENEAFATKGELEMALCSAYRTEITGALQRVRRATQWRVPLERRVRRNQRRKERSRSNAGLDTGKDK